MFKQESIDTALSQIKEEYKKHNLFQVKLLASDRFIAHLKDRDLTFLKDDLQTFVDLLPPIEVNSESSFYHPYQAWVANKIIWISATNLHWSNWLTVPSEHLTEFVVKHQKRANKSLKDFEEEVAEFYQLLALLVKIDSYCIPIIRKKLSLSLVDPRNDNYQYYLTWRHSFNIRAILAESSISIDRIKKWHEILSANAGIINDARNWYLLMRHASFDKRSKLRGKLKLSFDLYEMAESLKTILSLIGEDVQAEDDYLTTGGYWKKGFYGVEEIDFAKRLVLKRLLREYDLDASYKVYWFLEGPTEIGFIEAFSEATATNIDEQGIAIINLGGTGDITRTRKEVSKRLRGAKSFVEQLRRLKTDEVFTFITADDDQGITEGLESLRKQELISAGFVKWKGDFEESNFTISELINILQSMSEYPIAIFPEEIEEERKKLNNAGIPKALGEAIEVVAKRKKGLEQFSKGEEWGKTLANYALDNLNLDNDLRPIIKIFNKVIFATECDFRGTLENLECNSDGNMVARPKAD